MQIDNIVTFKNIKTILELNMPKIKIILHNILNSLIS